ncbi:MAG: GspE/PulE family protein [Gammaproteobacteria bacterium]|nr:GspE/PulE family protein [Gammaproteobacteria bacterium]
MAAVIPKNLRLGDLLLAERIITPEQLDAALKNQKATGRKLGRELVASGYISSTQLATFLSRQLGLPFIDLRKYEINPAIVKRIPELYCRRYQVVALAETTQELVIGMADPTDIFAHDEIARLAQKTIKSVVAKEEDVLEIIDKVFQQHTDVSNIAAEIEMTAPEANDAVSLSDSNNDAPVVRFLNALFEHAVNSGASDIHIEPDDQKLAIRIRQDGLLRTHTTADKRVAQPLISRLKLLAHLDISEKRLPQDGRFNIEVRGQRIDVRISSIPTQNNYESVVMRLLAQARDSLNLEQSGMPPALLQQFRQLIHSPHGVILVTGPTGSGKTTTLYGALREINDPQRKILTVEDPVEYRLPGVNQVQINTKIGLDFANVLRSFLRQDPDILLVGEIRDQETAEIALRAAMTGHLVLSSLHTNDAVSTPLRLIDMGAEPFLIAATLRGVVAQRLVRRVCEHCATVHTLDNDTLQLLKSQFGPHVAEMQFKKGVGCNQCQDMGYRGRIGIYELMEMNSELARTLQRSGHNDFAIAARRQTNYVSLKMSAFTLAQQGITSIDEVLRVTYGMD